MSPDNRARVFKTNPGPRHSRIAIGIDKIDLPAKKDVTVIRAARDQNQRADENDFRREREPPPHAPFKSAIGNSQFEIRLRAFSSVVRAASNAFGVGHWSKRVNLWPGAMGL
jgi:hypothetical protein